METNKLTMELISVIIPIYNTEKYLDKCIESIVNQTYKNLEIILVNDGSTDNSGGLCDEWAKKDDRIKVFHKPNGGLMNAWKYGVLHSIGKYIGFVDSDDWVDENMYEILLKIAVQDNTQMVLSNLVYEYGKKNRKDFHLIEGGKYSREQIEKEIFPKMIRYRYRRGISPCRVTKLFHKDLLLNILHLCDERVSIGEDLITTFLVMSKAERISFIADFYPYHYRINPESMIRSYSETKYEKIKILHDSLKELSQECEYDFSLQIEIDYVSLLLEQIEAEILFSGKNNRDLKKSLVDKKAKFLSKSLSVVRYSQFCNKQKLYLFLIKPKPYGIPDSSA